MWQGVAIEKNAFGFLCSMTILFLLSARYRQWREHTKPGGRLLPWIDMFIVLTAAFLLSGAQKNSATAGGSLAAGAATFIGMIFLRKVKLGLPQVILLALVLSLIVFGMSAPLLGGGGVVGFSSQFGRDATLTGRTEIWAGLLPEVEQRPLLGFGFGSFWTSHRRIVHDISDGHNGYLDVLLDLGAVGLSIYSAWFMLAARKLHKALSLDYDRATLAVSFLVMTLAFNITESTLSALVQPMTAVAILVSMLVPYEAARVRLPDELSDVGDPATMSQLARSALPGVFFERYEDIVATLGERTRSECARLHWYCGTVDRPLIS
jgi:O-antigen ligase